MPTNTYPSTEESFKDAASNAASSVSDKVMDAASQAKDKVNELGRTAANKIDENRGSAASGLDTAASTLRDKASSLPGGESVTRFAQETADKLHSTADYVRQHDVNSMMGDLEHMVKRNPGPSLVAAAVVGFLIGRAFTSND